MVLLASYHNPVYTRARRSALGNTGYLPDMAGKELFRGVQGTPVLTHRALIEVLLRATDSRLACNREYHLHYAIIPRRGGYWHCIGYHEWTE